MKKYIGWIGKDIKLDELFNNNYQGCKIEPCYTIWNKNIKPNKKIYRKIRITIEEVYN